MSDNNSNTTQVDHTQSKDKAPPAEKCPVDHTAMKDQSKSGEKYPDHTAKKEEPKSGEKCPVDHTAKKEEPKSGEKCPVDHTAKKEEPKSSEKCPVDHTTYKHFVPPSDNSEQTCPVDPASYKHFIPPVKEGCDSEAIDSSNNMPKISQESHADQKMPLDQHREISTIPRANSDQQLWIYPSEQMFFNAMKRKNWSADEKDMSVVVPIHNAVNEMAWRKILEWEGMHDTECNQPKLLKFEGRPKDITPKARIRSWFGYTLPFDRHDWVVDRCGEKVTYIIDFYSGKQDPNKPMSLSFYLDVRPAVSPSGIWDRIKMSLKKGEIV